MAQIEDLKEWFEDKSSALVAVSGGVDSALVAHAAFSVLGNNSVAVTADYKTQSMDEMNSARQVCSQIGIRHATISYDELSDEYFAANDKNRCFYCRMQLGKYLRKYARANSLDVIVDGTNTDDMGDYRPGISALRKYGVQSPLLDAGFTKAEVRSVAQEVGLLVHDRPSNSCLASRIPWGTRVTEERLGRIEMAEVAVREITGARTVRVRDINDTARVEVGSDELGLLSAGVKNAVSRALVDSGFDAAEFDPNGYRQGKINVIQG